MATKPIPAGYHSVTPNLVVENAAKVIDFATRAFGAQLRHRMDNPDGTIMHAEVKIGDSIVMLRDASGYCQPTPASLFLSVPDADAVYKRALEAGATSTMPLADQFWGDRAGGVKDPAGNSWMIATHKEDAPPAEIKQRAEAHLLQHAK
jgi:PhnB protein